MKNEIFCIKKIFKNKKLVEIPIHKKTAIFKFTKKYENKKKTIWLKEEDDLLINLSHKMKRNKWKLTSTLLTNKSAYQCYLRYKKLNPIIKKGRWSEYEDKFLIKLVNIFGKSWKSISKIIKTRTNKQIRNRYEEYLNENLNKGIFTKEEDKQLISLYGNLHDNWFKYKEHIQNRSIKKIKCRINFLINRQKSIKIKEKTININSYIYSSDDSLKETLLTQESDSNYKQEKIRKISENNFSKKENFNEYTHNQNNFNNSNINQQNIINNQQKLYFNKFLDEKLFSLLPSKNNNEKYPYKDSLII